jgi:hypothetical protein
VGERIMLASRILVAEDEDHTPIKIQRKLKFWRYKTPANAFYRRVEVNNAEKLKGDIIAC